MRLCPSVEGSASPLITHRIGAEVCLARQAANFHKCHRCIYRGQAADWQPEGGAAQVLEIEVGLVPKRLRERPVEIERPAVQKKAGAGKKPAAKPARSRAASAAE